MYRVLANPTYQPSEKKVQGRAGIQRELHSHSVNNYAGFESYPLHMEPFYRVDTDGATHKQEIDEKSDGGSPRGHTLRTQS